MNGIIKDMENGNLNLLLNILILLSIKYVSEEYFFHFSHKKYKLLLTKTKIRYLRESFYINNISKENNLLIKFIFIYLKN